MVYSLVSQSERNVFLENHRKAAAVSHLSCFDCASGAGGKIRARRWCFRFTRSFPERLLSVISAVTRADSACRVGASGGAGDFVAAVYTFVRIFTQHGAFCAGWRGLCWACAWGCSSLSRSGVLTILDPRSASSWGFPCASTRSRSCRKATEYYAAQVNRLSGLVSRDADSLAHLDDL